MKTLNEYITEKLKVSKNQNQNKYNYCPQTREELDDLLDQLLKERGWEADLNDIDTSNITDMSGLFAKYRVDINKFKYNKNYNFSEFNGDISKWDVSNVTDMEGIFYWCEKFEGKGLENWDVSNVINMKYMFYNCITFNYNLSNWDVSNVTNMHGMFYWCINFDGKCLENWDVSNVKNMCEMFYGCEKLNCDLSNWDVSNVENMKFMFGSCFNFEGKGLENWDVSNVIDMYMMFYNCEKLDCDLSGWNVSNITQYDTYIFYKCPIKAEYKPKFE